MTSGSKITAAFVENETNSVLFNLYAIALYCLPAEIRNQPAWKVADQLFDDAIAAVRWPCSSEDAACARDKFLSACIYLDELGLDLRELPLLAVNPLRYADAREALGLPGPSEKG